METLPGISWVWERSQASLEALEACLSRWSRRLGFEGFSKAAEVPMCAKLQGEEGENSLETRLIEGGVQGLTLVPLEVSSGMNSS